MLIDESNSGALQSGPHRCRVIPCWLPASSFAAVGRFA